MKEIVKIKHIPTLSEYNQSRLTADKILTGKEFRRLKRKGLIELI